MTLSDLAGQTQWFEALEFEGAERELEAFFDAVSEPLEPGAGAECVFLPADLERWNQRSRA